MLKRFYGLTIIFLLAGCASVPESIQVDENMPLVTYQQAASNPDGNVDKAVRWGGVVALVENLAESTMIEMVHYDLRSYGRPLLSNQSVGRFRVYVDGFLDPMVFEQGRLVTFAGKFNGVEEGTVGEHNYVFPSIKSSGYHLWKDIDRVEISDIHIFPYHSYWGWPHRPFHQRVIIRSNNNQPSGGSTTPTREPSQTSGNSSSAGRTSTGEPVIRKQH